MRQPEHGGVDLSLNAADRAFRDELRRQFIEVVPADVRAAESAGHELTKDQIVRSQRSLHAVGLAVPRWPVRWGGRDWTELQHHLWLSELQLAGVPIPFGLNTNMVGPVLAEFGTPEQQERFLPATAALDLWWVQGFSEPGSGSDLASVSTRAVLDGDHYVVSGQKTWISFAPSGDWMFTLVRTGPADGPPREGLTFLLIDLTAPGITIRPIEFVDGSREVNDVFLDEVRVPLADVVGEPGRGWSYTKFLLGNERVGVAPSATTQRMLGNAKTAACRPRPDGTRPLDEPALAARFAELETELLSLELTELRIAASSTDGRAQPVSSILKLVGTEQRQAVTELALEIAGTEALTTVAPLAATTYLNYRKGSIYGGTNEIQRQVIATSILGLRG
jgi:alkylation response protein AidB-like acyl-CoA dehydrogenase